MLWPFYREPGVRTSEGAVSGMEALETPFYMYDAASKDYVGSANPYFSTAPNNAQQCVYGHHHNHQHYNYSKTSTGLHPYAPSTMPFVEDTSLMDTGSFQYGHMMHSAAHAHLSGAPVGAAGQWFQCGGYSQSAPAAHQQKIPKTEEGRETEEEKKPRYSWLKQTKSRAGEWKRGWAGTSTLRCEWKRGWAGTSMLRCEWKRGWAGT